MIRKFVPQLEVLAPEQKQIWPQLAPTTKLGLVLYGGTAVALQLGHRLSVDFDFFTDRPLDRDEIRFAFPFLKTSTLLQQGPNTLTFLISSNAVQSSQAKISFFGAIDHGRVGEPRLTNDDVLTVASLDDLMATKLKTLFQRIEAKDYRDVAAMLKAGVSLSRGMASASLLYGKANFQPSESMKALVYFQGGDLDTLSIQERRLLVEAVGTIGELPPVDVLSKSLALR